MVDLPPSEARSGDEPADDDLTTLLELEQLVGIASSHTDALGEKRSASLDTRLAILRALGHEVATSADAATALAKERLRRAAEPVPPVVVAWEGDITLETQFGGLMTWILEPVDLNDPDEGIARQGATRDNAVTLTGLPYGFHRLTFGDKRSTTTLVISAPRQTWDEAFTADHHRWGILAPASSLWDRGARTGGTLAHLAEAADWASDLGATVIAALPLLAGPDNDPSPYTPVSRRFWDERMLVLGELGLDELQIDPTAEWGEPLAERAELAAMIDQLLADDAGARRAAQTHLEANRDARHYAQFRAAQVAHGRNWRDWPEAARVGRLDAAELDEKLVLRHGFYQWAADQQLAGLTKHLADRSMELYLDLPIGANPDGYDHWLWQDVFADGVEVGAPPDLLFSGGQAWGFAPLVPESARGDEHRNFRMSVEAHMRHADILRLDHAMSLERLYWLVDDARDGVYVYQPMEELLAIVTVLSHRHRCAVIGENLGTVSETITAALADHGIRGMHIAMFDPLALPEPGTVASINSHDLPTFAGWWNGDDIDLTDELELVEPERSAEFRTGRKKMRDELAARAEASPSMGDVPASVAHQMVERLGHSEAALVLVSVDDLWNDRRPFNVPGTMRPQNWVKRTSVALDEWAEVQAALLRTLDRARREASDHGTWPPPGWWFGADDQHLFNAGNNIRLWHGLGGRVDHVDGVPGVRFAVWAPNAASVHVIGDFTGWGHPGVPLQPVGSSGVWDGFIAELGAGTRYKYRIESSRGTVVEKADPLSFHGEVPPATASIVDELHYEWDDDQWMRERGRRNRWDEPISIYEVHLGSWRRVPGDGNRSLSYLEHVDALVAHVESMGFTHVEFLPLTEHPLYASWGYQTTGYFAATSRYGSPTELMALIDAFHRADIGVILDWVPSHFPTDEFGLNAFDGTQLYEHADPREGFHPDWKSSIFNYGRHEVRSFLLSSARFWLEAFHIDGLRVDAVASMLYRDYSRGDDWVPNRYGGRENLEAITFLQQLNHEMYQAYPDVLMIAEESTAWPGVTKPTDQGGLGFGYKWDMGWMNDTLEYFRKDPVHRKFEHNKLTFRALYGFGENYVLPLSHDEVVHGKGSLLNKMPGDEWQKFANLRVLLGYQYATPGKKLLFMGSELAPWTEWNHDESLPWHLTDESRHEGMLQWVARLNRVYRDVPALYSGDTSPEGFAWVEADDAEQSIFTFLRLDADGDALLVAMNNTPVPRNEVRTGVPIGGSWSVVACSDDSAFGGTDYLSERTVASEAVAHAGYEQSVRLTLPALSITYWRHEP